MLENNNNTQPDVAALIEALEKEILHERESLGSALGFPPSDRLTLYQRSLSAIARLTARIAELEAEVKRPQMDVSAVAGFEAGRSEAAEELASLNATIARQAESLDGYRRWLSRLQGELVAEAERLYHTAGSGDGNKLMADACQNKAVGIGIALAELRRRGVEVGE
jgi:Mg2+ and Co2+ transporter CorA